MEIKQITTEKLVKNVKYNFVWYISCTLSALFLILYIALIGMYTAAIISFFTMLTMATHFLVMHTRDVLRLEVRNK